MKIALLWIIIFLIEPLKASVEAEYHESLRAAGSIVEVSMVEMNYLQLIKAQALCRQQLKKSRIPGACYQLLELRSKGFWRGSKIDQISARRLDQLCLIAEEVRPQEQQYYDLMSEDCRLHIRKRLEVYRYKKEFSGQIFDS